MRCDRNRKCANHPGKKTSTLLLANKISKKVLLATTHPPQPPNYQGTERWEQDTAPINCLPSHHSSMMSMRLRRPTIGRSSSQSCGFSSSPKSCPS